MDKINLKSILIISLLLLSFINCKEEYPTIRISIPDDFTGFGYLVGSSKEENVYSKDKKYFLNKYGIAYIDTSIINNGFKPGLYKKHKLLKESDVKFLRTTDIQKSVSGKEVGIVSRKIFLFYVLDKDKLEKGDGYWRDEAHRHPITLKQLQYTDSLIDAGVIKIE